MQDEVRLLFDEDDYLARHPDIAAAVESGKLKSGFDHFIRRGQHEGRAISGFQPDVYLSSYPLAAEEIAAGRAANALDHFLKFGRARGYLPTRTAPRADNSAALPNKFGGFWYDQPNALDIVDGKLAVGQINEEQAALLKFWIEQGYVILPNAVQEDVLQAALIDFDKAYSGGIPDLRFECQQVTKTRAARPWQMEMNAVPTKALDIHYYSFAIRNLIFDRKISQFLALLFDAPAFATQTLGFLLGSAQSGHQDSAYVAYSIPRQFCATWIALEDVTPGCGELFYYPGSHKIPDFLYSGRYKSFHEAIRLGQEEFPHGEVSRHVESLKERAKEFGLKRELLMAKRGDVLFWHADLVHGGSPISQQATRKSVVTHYCPKFISPLYAENRKTRIYHHGEHLFSSSYYLHAAPAMAVSEPVEALA